MDDSGESSENDFELDQEDVLDEEDEEVEGKETIENPVAND